MRRFFVLFFLAVLVCLAQTKGPKKAKANASPTTYTYTDIRPDKEKAKDAAERSSVATGSASSEGIGSSSQASTNSKSNISTSWTVGGASSASSGPTFNPFGVQDEGKFIKDALEGVRQTGDFYTIPLEERIRLSEREEMGRSAYSAKILRNLCAEFEKSHNLDIQGTPQIIEETYLGNMGQRLGKALFFKALPKK